MIKHITCLAVPSTEHALMPFTIGKSYAAFAERDEYGIEFYVSNDFGIRHYMSRAFAELYFSGVDEAIAAGETQ
jgi:hypothetical protein